MTRSNCVVCNFEACKNYFVHGELKIFGVQSDAVSSTYVEPLGCWEEAIHRRVSSMHFVLAGKVDTISSYLLEYPSPDAM